ncbi:MAG TPA: hypothetical protein VF610_04100 [Segetibacter sp.]
MEIIFFYYFNNAHFIIKLLTSYFFPFLAIEYYPTKFPLQQARFYQNFFQKPFG